MKYQLYPERQSKWRYVSRAFWWVVWGFVILSLYALLYHPDWIVMGNVGATAPTFSHENCQYPDRWTNPVDSCDNSDPAVPECIKAFSTEQGEKDCIDEFVKTHEQLEVQQVPSIAESTAVEPTKECGK